LLCTADGSLPPKEELEHIWNLFRSAGIEPWELFVVDNDMNSQGAIEAGPAPLEYFRSEVIAAKATKK